MDQLLQEIREGTTLRPTRRRSSRSRNTQVSLEDLKKLQEMAKKGEEAFARRASQITEEDLPTVNEIAETD